MNHAYAHWRADPFDDTGRTEHDAAPAWDPTWGHWRRRHRRWGRVRRTVFFLTALAFQVAVFALTVGAAVWSVQWAWGVIFG